MTERLLNHTQDIFKSACEVVCGQLPVGTFGDGARSAVVQAAAILTLADCVRRVDIDSDQLAKALDGVATAVEKAGSSVGDCVERGLNDLGVEFRKAANL